MSLMGLRHKDLVGWKKIGDIPSEIITTNVIQPMPQLGQKPNMARLKGAKWNLTISKKRPSKPARF